MTRASTIATLVVAVLRISSAIAVFDQSSSSPRLARLVMGFRTACASPWRVGVQADDRPDLQQTGSLGISKPTSGGLDRSKCLVGLV